MNKKVILIIRDGWGYKKKTFKNLFFFKKTFNAIELADTKNTDIFEREYPTIHLHASGKYVGLPDNFMGNSEVGHITIGAGEIINQSLLRINNEIKNKIFLKNKIILKSIKNIKKNNSKLHLIILMQESGVHSYLNHLFETLKFCKKEELKKNQVILHLISDGRDESPTSSVSFLSEIKKKMKQINLGKIGTISGRYFAMDRNKNFDRTEKYFKTFFYAKSEESFSSPIKKINSFYQKDITDEFLPPMLEKSYQGVKKNDSIIFLNFRKDRAIQISKKIEEKIKELNLNFSTITRYYNSFSGNVIFEDVKIKNTLSDILEKNNKTQLRISETEKYAHVTFFFDGGIYKKHKNKEELLINSPKVDTYDLKPEMSSKELTQKIIFEIATKKQDFILINYPNADMVAHTGNLKATIKAIETIDKSIYDVVKSGIKNDYIIILTADHGNSEEISPNMRSHTKNKIPFTIISKNLKNQKNFLKKGDFGLSNILATILEVMEIQKDNQKDTSLIK